MKKSIIFLFFWTLLLIIACNNKETNDNIVEPKEPLNEILLNSSFEKDGQPFNDGWYIRNESLENYSTDVPENGGQFSLVLKGDTLGLPGQAARIILPAIMGNNIYKFSFWSRRQGSWGEVNMYIKTSDTSGYFTRSALVLDSTWTSYSFIDTIQTDEDDSLVFIIGGEHAWLPDGKVYFDLCKLEKINLN